MFLASLSAFPMNYVCTHTHLAPNHGIDQLLLQAAVPIVGPTGGCSHGAFLPSSAGHDQALKKQRI